MKRLGVFAVLGAAGLTAISYAWQPNGFVVMATLAYAAAAAGALAGALTFAPGDHMRRAWLALAIAIINAGIYCVIFRSPPSHAIAVAPSGPAVEAVRMVSDILLNGLTVVGLALFSRAWRSAGLTPPWYRQAAVLAFVVGAAVAGPALVDDVREVIAGTGHPWPSLISSLGDLVSITLIGPLAASAVAMRGGALVWPYVFLTADCVSWLVWDASGLLHGDMQLACDMFFSMAGLLFTGAAGLAHRRVLRMRT